MTDVYQAGKRRENMKHLWALAGRVGPEEQTSESLR